MVSKYILQKATKTHCPHCHKTVDLLCTDDDMLKSLKTHHWFYICFPCKFIAEVGHGEVKKDEESYRRGN